MQAQVSAHAHRVTEPNFRPGSVKDRVLETVHKLGKQATRSMIFVARISTDETVDAALEGLLRDKYLTEQPGERYELTDAGYSAIDVEPQYVPATEAGPSLKQCRTCRAFKDRYKEFSRAPRSPDFRTLDCNECRKGELPAPAAAATDLPAQVAATNEAKRLPETSADQPAVAPPLVLALPTIMGVYVKIDGERVYISQPGQEAQPLHLNRERGLALGQFLCEHLGMAETK